MVHKLVCFIIVKYVVFFVGTDKLNAYRGSTHSRYVTVYISLFLVTFVNTMVYRYQIKLKQYIITTAIYNIHNMQERERESYILSLKNLM